MNMQVLKPSRKYPQPGDIFTYRLKGRDFGYGRVVRTDCLFGGERDVILIYIYNVMSAAKLEIPELSRDGLLIPPKLINRLPWWHGYFETLCNRPLGPSDVLRIHCFSEGKRGPYVEEDRQRLGRRSEPCGWYGLSSFRTIDSAISRALGVEPSPDTVPPPPPPEHIQERRRREWAQYVAWKRRERRKGGRQ